MSIGFFGPTGTYTEEALLRLLGPRSERSTVPYPSIGYCVDAVTRVLIDQVVVPIQNSIECAVNVTLDQLAAADGRIVIQAEVVLPIRHHLIVRPGLTLGLSAAWMS